MKDEEVQVGRRVICVYDDYLYNGKVGTITKVNRDPDDNTVWKYIVEDEFGRSIGISWGSVTSWALFDDTPSQLLMESI